MKNERRGYAMYPLRFFKCQKNSSKDFQTAVQNGFCYAFTGYKQIKKSLSFVGCEAKKFEIKCPISKCSFVLNR